MQKTMEKREKIDANLELGTEGRNSGFWKGLGRVLARFGKGFGGVLEALGSSWAVLWPRFFVLVLGMVFKRALGGLWARFWLDLGGSGRGHGRVSDVKMCVFLFDFEVWSENND